jgi:hypothetical protein
MKIAISSNAAHLTGIKGMEKPGIDVSVNRRIGERACLRFEACPEPVEGFEVLYVCHCEEYLDGRG